MWYSFFKHVARQTGIILQALECMVDKISGQWMYWYSRGDTITVIVRMEKRLDLAAQDNTSSRKADN